MTSDSSECHGSLELSEPEDRLAEVILACEEAADAGQAPDPDEVIAQHPTLAEELRSYFANQNYVGRIILPLREQAPLSSAPAPSRPGDTTPHVGAAGSPSTDPVCADSTEALPAIPDHEILGVLGGGGMGVVYRARHKSLDRQVALKTIRAGQFASAEEIQRFHNEARAVASLDHPHIVPIYQFGVHANHHYLTMKLVEGESLADRLGIPMPGRQAAELVETLGRAIHHAHQADIIHRDLKPANVLLDSEGRPHITDFGLAKRLGDTEGKTQTGAILGTVSYMAPEQALGEPNKIGPATDIHALGMILYECLTGRPPFQASSVLDTLALIRSSQPVPPQLLNRTIDRDLETICLKCLEKGPQQRYASAKELADDLRYYLNGEPIRARPINLLDRVLRTIGHSGQEAQFQSWSSMLLLFSLIILLGHVTTFLFLQTSTPAWLVWSARLAPIPLAGLVFCCHRKRRLLPASPAEREVWSIWLGYLLCYGTHALVNSLPSDGGATQGPASHYIVPAILSGFAFFIMGSNYWGWCYAFGLAFLALAMLIPFTLQAAPLAFGLLWSAILAILSLHLRRLGNEVAREE